VGAHPPALADAARDPGSALLVRPARLPGDVDFGHRPADTTSPPPPGSQATGEAIIARFRQGEPAAVAAFDRYVDRLGRAIAVLVNIADPDVLVLGGGLSNVDEIYERLPALIAPRVFSDRWSARIAPARWGDASGVRGAARLWNDAQAAVLASV
jgi:fructokinase